MDTTYNLKYRSKYGFSDTCLYENIDGTEVGPLQITIKEYTDQKFFERERDGFVHISNECRNSKVTTGCDILLDGKGALAYDSGFLNLPAYIDFLLSEYEFSAKGVDLLLMNLFNSLYDALSCIFNEGNFRIELWAHNVMVHFESGTMDQGNEIFSVANLDQRRIDFTLTPPAVNVDATDPSDKRESYMIKTMNSMFMLMINVACMCNPKAVFEDIKNKLVSSNFDVLVGSGVNSFRWAAQTAYPGCSFLNALSHGYVAALHMFNNGKSANDAFIALYNIATK